MLVKEWIVGKGQRRRCVATHWSASVLVSLPCVPVQSNVDDLISSESVYPCLPGIIECWSTCGRTRRRRNRKRGWKKRRVSKGSLAKLHICGWWLDGVTPLCLTLSTTTSAPFTVVQEEIRKWHYEKYGKSILASWHAMGRSKEKLTMAMRKMSSVVTHSEPMCRWHLIGGNDDKIIKLNYSLWGTQSVGVLGWKVVFFLSSVALDGIPLFINNSLRKL